MGSCPRCVASCCALANSIRACAAICAACAATLRSCGDGSAGASAAARIRSRFLERLFRRLAWRNVDPHVTGNGVLLTIGATHRGELCAPCHQSSARSDMRRFVRAHLAVDFTQPSYLLRRFGVLPHRRARTPSIRSTLLHRTHAGWQGSDSGNCRDRHDALLHEHHSPGNP